MASASSSILRAAEPDLIVVDLDGTLVLTDTFVVTIIEAVRRNPFNLLSLIAAFVRSCADCKRLAAALGPVDVKALPYNEPLLEYLRAERVRGKRLVLATGANETIARGVAEHLGIFEEVIASGGHRSVTGQEKVRALRELFGDEPFTYAGNSQADLKVWRHSESAILVGTPRMSRQLKRAGIVVQREIAGPSVRLKKIVSCLRCYQWAKNLLVFLPLILSHQVRNVHLLWQGVVSFLALSFCASALYIVNDLLDLQGDRLHPQKRRRPLASGQLSIGAGLLLALLSGSAGIALGFALPVYARILLLGYALTSFSYSMKLKQFLFFDITVLSLLYAFRVLYGGAAMGIRISVWTLAFSLFLFTSLAALKRLTELRKGYALKREEGHFRGYKDVDAGQLASLASSAGYAAVLVLALYINSPEVQLLYKRPEGLWLLCPILIYWISRFTLIANRGHLDDDPVAFALKDRSTWAAGAAAMLILLLST